MIVRILDSNDVTSLYSLETELFDHPFNSDSCSTELSTANRLYVGIFNNDILIGYAGAMIVDDTADIIKVGVTKKEQHKGYATRLMTILLQLLKDNGVKSVLLEVESKNNNAINLYKKCGFENISERKNYYGENSHASIMKLDLNNEL